MAPLNLCNKIRYVLFYIIFTVFMVLPRSITFYDFIMTMS